MLALAPAGGRPLRVALLGAHCDDIEIGCGGMLLDLARRGSLSAAEGLIVSATAERQEEAIASLTAFCSPVSPVLRFGDVPDGRLPGHWNAVKDLLEEFAARTTADLVLAPSPADAHQDHRLLGELVRTAFRDHLVLHYEIPKWDGDLGAGRCQTYWPLPAALVGTKFELLYQHYPSQRSRAWFREDTFTALARLRGMECRSDYAEAFTCPAMVLAAPGHTDADAAPG